MFQMPYLNFESNGDRKKMRKVIDTCTAENIGETPTNSVLVSARQTSTPDEALIKGYVRHGLHVRRTLDQFYYSMLNTSRRDGDQVVYRHAQARGAVTDDVKILMVDQLWLWIIGGTLSVYFKSQLQLRHVRYSDYMFPSEMGIMPRRQA